jgi:putative endonuclease
LGISEVKLPAVYIMASKRNGTIYTGVTSNLVQRVWLHREGTADGFTKKYGCKNLVWFELHDRMDGAIAREKQIKAGSRAKKLALIEGMNPAWKDLYEDIGSS